MDFFKDVAKASGKVVKTIQDVSLGALNMTGIPQQFFPKTTRKKIGKAPGEIVYTGSARDEKVTIDIIDYNKKGLKEIRVDSIEEAFSYRDTKSTTWINITGIHDTELIKKTGDHFKLHKLLMEDVANVSQRPKVEEFENTIFAVVKMLRYDSERHAIDVEQLSFVMGRNFLISFQERPGDVFEPVRQRIRDGKTKIRELGSDYLLYALLDVIVDTHYLILEDVGDYIETIESAVLTKPDTSVQQSIYRMKRELLLLRKSVWPLREAISSIQKSESKLLSSLTRLYVRDLYDHTIQLVDTVETFRDMLSGMLDLYMSSVSNRMNEVMKVLTIIATIFIPLTFLAGIYGMNFKYMPELSIRWFYPFLLGLMVVIAGGMVYYFRRKGWL